MIEHFLRTAKALVSQPAYHACRRLLRIVLGSALGGLALGYTALVMLQGPPLWEVALSFLAAVAMTMAALCIALSLLYALAVRVGYGASKTDAQHGVSPTVTAQKGYISRHDAIIGIVASVFVSTLLLFTPELISARLVEAQGGAMWVPLFDLTLLCSGGSRALLVVMASLSLALGALRLLEGRHTKRLCIATLVHCAIGIPLVLLLERFALAPNPAFLLVAGRIFTGGASRLLGIFTQMPKLVGFVLLLNLTLDAASAVYNTLRYGRN